jgi:hypothetical protein
MVYILELDNDGDLSDSRSDIVIRLNRMQSIAFSGWILQSQTADQKEIDDGSWSVR